MDAAVIRPTTHHRLALALCAATAVHLGLLALPLAERPRAAGAEVLHVRLIAPAVIPESRPVATEPSRPSPHTPSPAPAPAPMPAPAPSPVAQPVAAPAPAAPAAPAPAADQSAPAAKLAATASAETAVAAAQGEVRLALARHFRYPLLARRRGWQGEVLLGVQVAADGSLGAPTVLRSSGHAVLDRAALEALARVPTLSSAPGMAFTLQLPVHYRLEEG